MRSAPALLLDRYYVSEEHPFNIYEKRIGSLINEESTVLDAGCGATAPVLVKLAGKCGKLIGVDLAEFDPSLQGSELQLINSDLAGINTIETGSIDLVISRSVLEHVRDIEGVYKELNRVLKPGAMFIFLVPNLWDYVSILSCLIPNRFHQCLVKSISDRPADNVFPTYYKSNTRRSIQALAARHGFQVSQLQHLGQYPYMLEFNTLLFLLGIHYDKFVCRHRGLEFLRSWILCELRKV